MSSQRLYDELIETLQLMQRMPNNVALRQNFNIQESFALTQMTPELRARYLAEKQNYLVPQMVPIYAPPIGTTLDDKPKPRDEPPSPLPQDGNIDELVEKIPTGKTKPTPSKSIDWESMAPYLIGGAAVLLFLMKR